MTVSSESLSLKAQMFYIIYALNHCAGSFPAGIRTLNLSQVHPPYRQVVTIQCLFSGLNPNVFHAALYVTEMEAKNIVCSARAWPE